MRTYTTTAWLPISDAPHLIEIDWQAATGSGVNNGSLTLWIDGVIFSVAPAPA